MKKIIACTLILSMLSTTGVMCFAETESSAAISKFEKVLDKIDAPVSEKAEIKKDLEAVKNGEILTPQKKESLGNRIKNFFKKHWKKVIAIGSAVVALALLGVGIIATALGITKHHQDKKKSVKQFSGEKEEQKEVVDPTEESEKSSESSSGSSSSESEEPQLPKEENKVQFKKDVELLKTNVELLAKAIDADDWKEVDTLCQPEMAIKVYCKVGGYCLTILQLFCFMISHLEKQDLNKAKGCLKDAIMFLEEAGITSLEVNGQSVEVEDMKNIEAKDLNVETVKNYTRAMVPILQLVIKWCDEVE